MKKKRHEWRRNRIYAGGSYCVNCGYSKEVARIKKTACKGKP